MAHFPTRFSLSLIAALATSPVLAQTPRQRTRPAPAPKPTTLTVPAVQVVTSSDGVYYCPVDLRQNPPVIRDKIPGLMQYQFEFSVSPDNYYSTTTVHNPTKSIAVRSLRYFTNEQGVGMFSVISSTMRGKDGKIVQPDQDQIPRFNLLNQMPYTLCALFVGIHQAKVRGPASQRDFKTYDANIAFTPTGPVERSPVTNKNTPTVGQGHASP